MTPLKIYMVDDDQEDRELFIDALSEIPILTEVVQFDNGVDLMADLFSNNPLPNIVFLDLYMPILDGFECLADIRSFPKFSEIKVIVYSTTYREREVKQLKEDGANQYIQKPNSFNQLKTLLYQSIQPIAEGMEAMNPTNKFIIRK